MDGVLGAQRAVLESSLTSVEKLTLTAVLNFWSKASPLPYPSAETLARLTSLDERTIRRTIKSLADKGTLNVIPEPGRPNKYDLTPVFENALPRMESHPNPGRCVTPGGESPLTDDPGYPGRCVTPPLTESPGTPGAVPPEVTQEVTQEVERVARARSSKKWTTVPDGWKPTGKHKVRAKVLGVDIEHEAETFRHHEFAKPKTDADRAFMVWLQRARGFARPNGANTCASATPLSLVPIQVPADFEREHAARRSAP